MKTITFKTEAAHVAFHAMAEGMWEVARDDHVSATGDEGPRAKRFAAVIRATSWQDNADYPVSFTLADNAATDDAFTAAIVLENMRESDDDSIAAVDQIELRPLVTDEMGAQEALEEAIAVLELRASETDTASPEGWRARAAHDTISRILQQRGCEHFDAACRDGKLTTLCDIIVYG